MDRPALNDGIEITPQMIEAAASELLIRLAEYDHDAATIGDVAEAVLAAGFRGLRSGA